MKRLAALVLSLLLAFTLFACSPGANGKPELSDIQTASEIGKNNAPDKKAVTSSFTPEAPVVYVTGTAKGAAGTVIKAVWYYNSVEPPVEMNSSEYTLKEKKENFSFNQPVPEGGWPPGQYEVRLFVNNVFNAKASFTVGGADTSVTASNG